MAGLDALGCADNEDIRPADEEAGFDDPGNLIQRDFELSWLLDLLQMHVYNEVSGLRPERGPVPFSERHPALGEGLDFARRASPAEGNDLNGQGERPAEDWYLLGRINQDDELFG